MRVAATAPRFPGRDPYTDIVEGAGGELVYGDCETEADVIEFVEETDPDVILDRSSPLTDRVMDAAGELELIMCQTTGYENVDVQAATARGIPVSNVPGYAPRDIAGHALALGIAASHDVIRSDRFVRDDGEGWFDERNTLYTLYDGTFGIVGMGRIGRHAVPLAQGLGMDVIAYDPYVDDDVFELLDVEPVSFDDLLERSDCITIHTPLTSITERMFSTEEFERMQDSAVLVNAARGKIVDEEALVDAVQSGEIRAAGLDVFEEEPPVGSPVLEDDRIVCSPHRAGATPQGDENVIDIVSGELERALRGETLENVVNPEVFQYRS